MYLELLICNLVPRALFPGFGGGEKRPGDEVVILPLQRIFSSLFKINQIHRCTPKSGLNCAL